MIVHVETSTYKLPGNPMTINVYWMTALHWHPQGTVAPAIWRKHCWPGIYYNSWHA